MTNEEYNAISAKREAKFYAMMDKSKKEADEHKKEADERKKEADERKKIADSEYAELRRDIQSINDRYGITQQNLGALTEEFFFKNLEKSKILGGVIYDDVEQGWKKSLKDVAGEYDIVMINGASLAIIEVKNKGHINDLIKLKENMLPNFKKLFSDYKDYKLYAGFASFFVTYEMKEFAKENGIYILERNGDVIATTAENINYW